MRKPPLPEPLLWHSWLLAAICGLLAAAWPLQAGIALVILVIITRRLWRLSALVCVCIVFFCACLYARHALTAQARLPAPAWINSDARFCGVVQTSQGMPDNRLRVILSEPRCDGSEPLPGLCQWTWQSPLKMPLPGQKVCLTRPVKPIRGFGNGEDAWETSLIAQKIYWRVWSEKDSGAPLIFGEPKAGAALRERLKTDFISLLQADKPGPMPQSRAILAALLFGDRSYLTQATTRLFASATLAHSLALSGQHLAIAAMIGSFLVLAAARLRPGLYLRKPKTILILTLAVPAGLLYLWLGNAPASLQRAFGMLFFAAIWLALGKPFSGADLLCAALACILLFNPMAIFDAGLQMSALCVAVILACAPAIAGVFPQRDHRRPSLANSLARRIALILAISLFIQLALLPLSLARFQIAGFWFPLNLIWLPALGLIVLPAAAIALILTLIPLQTAQICAEQAIRIAATPADLLLRLLDYLSGAGLLAEPVFLLPHWSLFLAFALIAVALAQRFCARLRNRSRIKAVLAIALLLLMVAPLLRIWHIVFGEPAIEAIDVGQGQAALLSLPGDMRILIDGGGSYNDRFDPGRAIVAPALARNSRPRLAAAINTHPDLDHLGGLFYIISHFNVGHVFHNGRDAPKGKAAKWQEMQLEHQAIALAAGDTIVIGDPANNLCLEVLQPPAGRNDLQGNAASLILRLVKDGRGVALFTGDADKESLKRALAASPDISAPLLFAPHHGSDKNLLPEFYEAAHPEIVIASCGYLNRWRYPGDRLCELLRQNGIKLLDTGNNGRIRITFQDWRNPEAIVMRGQTH